MVNIQEAAVSVKSFWFKAVIILFPFVSISLIYLFRNEISQLGSLLPGCPSYTYLHILCPGCGNTRSVQHILAGDVVGSIRFNPVPVFGIIVTAMAYIEVLAWSFQKPVKLLPRNKAFWVIIALIFSIYFIMRNFIKPF